MSSDPISMSSLKTSFPWNVSFWAVFLELGLSSILIFATLNLSQEALAFYIWLAIGVLMLPVFMIVSPNTLSSSWQNLFEIHGKVFFFLKKSTTYIFSKKSHLFSTAY